MATGDEKVNAALKRFLSQNRISENLIEYLSDQVIELGSEMFPSQGIFTYPIALSQAAGTFDVETSPSGDDIRGTDGEGNILTLAVARQTGISFEDIAATNYWIAVKKIQIPSGVYTNPRTTVPEYDKLTDEIGELDEPDTVVDNGSNLTITVNSIFESGVDHSGRSVRVWLKNPVDSDASVAFEDVTVAYSSPDNTITTSALLGQGSPSTVATDYQVACLGVTVRKSVSEPALFASGYMKLGYVVGNSGGVSIDNTVNLSAGGGHTLQKAYDGIGGSGSGREITVADQAVFLKQESVTNRDVDIANAALRIDKDVPTTLPDSRFLGEVAIDTKIGLSYPGAHLIRVPLADYAGGSKLLVEEDVDLPGSNNQIDFTRGGVLDLLLTGHSGKLYSDDRDFVEISGSSLGQDGLYFLNSVVDPNTLSVRNLDDTTPTFTTETGLKARVSRAIVKMGRQDRALDLTLMNDFYKEFGGAPFYQEGVRINVPANAANSDSIINVDKEVTGRLLELTGDGTLDCIQLEADIDVVAGNDVIADDDVIATNGDITAPNGLMVAGTTITAGTGLTVTTGNALVLAGNVVAGVDVTATGDVTAGDDVKADDDVVADADASGAGVFGYGLAKTREYYISPCDGLIGEPFLGGGRDWRYRGPQYTGETSVTPEILFALGNATEQIVMFPIHIPVGATITLFEAIFNQLSSNELDVSIVKQTQDWTTPLVNNPTAASAKFQNAATGIVVISSSGLSIPVNAGSGYGLRVRVATAVGGSAFYGAKITYTFTTVEPPI